ncbi:alpha/beta hydrolase [Nocardia arthritidis]|uniref:Enterochelin esterase n=1 Tax=Nocardia arthritidis TaxID=228602 RepID=A0A6G9YKV3_9NOCA|nr:alpha/beta hydrolase-fold protein [Nocardia arthritidis]QIS13834.1 enterochelin esterase [Nocardia arthritidis]
MTDFVPDFELSGRLEQHAFSSALLRGNPLGDPHERPLWVYLPPGYDARETERYPVVYVIQGYSGRLPMWGYRHPFKSPFVELVDRMFAAEEAPQAIVVYVDAWTKYGGSQFVDSPGTGRYHSYLCEEIVPWVDRNYRTIADREYRAIQGKSSGGFGAMITPMLRPDLFANFATHAGDALYEYSYIMEFGKGVRRLREYDGDIWAFWRDFSERMARGGPLKDTDSLLAMLLGLSACYSAGEDGVPELPFDPVTGVLREIPWQRWLDWDPVRMVPKYAEAMRSMRAIWIDGGTRDEWFLDIGAQAFRDALRANGVADDIIHFEHFDDGHAGIDYRYAPALGWLTRRMPTKPPAAG